jgi:hypothetical protein
MIGWPINKGDALIIFLQSMVTYMSMRWYEKYGILLSE